MAGWWMARAIRQMGKTQRYHWVSDGGLTMCKKWRYAIGEILPDRPDDSVGNCVECRNAKAKLAAEKP